MYRPLLSDTWIREYHCERARGIEDGIIRTPLTFCGVLESKYKSIADKWDDETRVKYDREYNNIILPHLTDHNTKLITDYTQQDCEDAINAIKEDGYLSKGNREEYADSQIKHFKRLIYTVFENAAAAGLCRDFLWGTKFSNVEEKYSDREALAKNSKTSIKRSLSVVQEKRLLEHLLETPEEDGRRIALLLMFSLGVRDGEACGLDFGGIYELPYHKGCYVAEIRQSTIPDTSKLQSSGKSWNTGRRIPIPKKVLNFLLQRKQIIERAIANNGLEVDISTIPVACKGYINEERTSFQRLKADDVTDMARELFKNKDVGIEADVLYSLEIEMEDEVKCLEVTESNVTAYLLRRNFATHLKILGLEYADIQYLLGHCIDDPYVNRPDYTDDKLFQLSLQLEKRPLVNETIDNDVLVRRYSEASFSGSKTIECVSDSDEIHIRIFASEKNDKLTVKLRDADDISQHIIMRETYKAFEPSRSIDIIKKYSDDYLRED